MQLNSKLSELLETYDPERLKALLLWLNAEQQSLAGQSQRLSAVLQEAHEQGMEGYYQSASKLEVRDIVEVSIMDEFGADFGKKSFFPWLTQKVCNRFSI